MTLCVSWIRRAGRTKELMLAADSLLNGGGDFMEAPKIFPLKRGDCAIACAGDTAYTFPIVTHILQSIDLNVKSRTRAQDFVELVHYFEELMNSCLASVVAPITDKDKGPDFQMLFVGYSAKLKDFKMVVFQYDKSRKVMKRRTEKTLKKNKVAVIGDKGATKKGETNLVSLYRRELFLRLEADCIGDNGCIDMQPLDVLNNIIKDNRYRTVSGHLQMLKICDFMSILPYAIMEDNNPESIYYMGRKLMNYETFPYPIYNLVGHDVFYMKETKEEFKRSDQEIAKLSQFAK